MKITRDSHTQYLVQTIIEALDWQHIMSQYGHEEYKLKFLTAIDDQVNSQGEVAAAWVVPTPEMLMIDLSEELFHVIENKIPIHIHRNWIIVQALEEQLQTEMGNQLEVFFTTVSCTVYEAKPMFKKKRKYGDKLITSYRRRKFNPKEFNDRLKNTNDKKLLNKLLEKSLSVEDYETAILIRKRTEALDEINTSNTLSEST